MKKDEGDSLKIALIVGAFVLLLYLLVFIAG